MRFCFAPLQLQAGQTPVIPIWKAPQPRMCDTSSRVIHANGQLKSHLQNLRLRGPNLVGGNLTHPAADPLWETPEVVQHVTKHNTFTPELRKANRKNSSRIHYNRTKQDRPLLERTLHALVKVKRITQAEADEILISRLPGGTKLKKKVEVLEQKVVTQDTQDLLPARNDAPSPPSLVAQQHAAELEAIQQREDFNRLLREKEQESEDTRHRLYMMSRNISALFNGTEYMANPGYKERVACTWPIEPSVEAFWVIYCMVVPHSEWMEVEGFPDVNQAWKRAQLLINPDRAGNPAISPDGTDMRSITAIFTASRDMCLKYIGLPTADDNTFGLAPEHQIVIEQVESPLGADETASRFSDMNDVWANVRHRFHMALIPGSHQHQFSFQHLSLFVDLASQEFGRLERDG
jgi:hypothetical protein